MVGLEKLVYAASVYFTESEEPVSKDDLDMVCSAIGKDWRRLSRKFGFSDGESGQLYQDFHAAGVYEIMYQVGQRTRYVTSGRGFDKSMF